MCNTKQKNIILEALKTDNSSYSDIDRLLMYFNSYNNEKNEELKIALNLIMCSLGDKIDIVINKISSITTIPNDESQEDNNIMNEDLKIVNQKLDSIVSGMGFLADNDKELKVAISELSKNQHQLEIKIEKHGVELGMIKWFIPILVTIIISVGVLFLNTSINSLKENNSMQIQKDVAQEILHLKGK